MKLKPKILVQPPRTLHIRSGASPVIIRLATTIQRPGTSPTTVIRMEVIPPPDPNEPHTVSVIDLSSVAIPGAKVALRLRPAGSGAWKNCPAQYTSADGKTTFAPVSGPPGLHELEFTASLGAVSASKTIKVLV